MGVVVWRLTGRVARGLSSLVAGFAFPLGGSWLPGLADLASARRLGHGLAVVLPGIEGGGPLNWGIARGLDDGGWPGAVIVHDWTTGLWPLGLYHLRARRRNRARAAAVARLVTAYRVAHPGRPVYLIGHSGGGGLAVWAAEALPPGPALTGVILLAPALSPGYPLGPALARVERAVWNFYSPLDVLFLAAGTLAFGTFDGPHAVASGCVGFRPHGRLRQRGFAPADAARFHLGGHFGWANRVFVAEAVAPLLAGRV